MERGRGSNCGPSPWRSEAWASGLVGGAPPPSLLMACPSPPVPLHFAAPAEPFGRCENRQVVGDQSINVIRVSEQFSSVVLERKKNRHQFSGLSWHHMGGRGAWERKRDITNLRLWSFDYLFLCGPLRPLWFTSFVQRRGRRFTAKDTESAEEKKRPSPIEFAPKWQFGARFGRLMGVVRRASCPPRKKKGHHLLRRKPVLATVS